jgi:hypothetical protein
MCKDPLGLKGGPKAKTTYFFLTVTVISAIVTAGLYIGFISSRNGQAATSYSSDLAIWKSQGLYSKMKSIYMAEKIYPYYEPVRNKARYGLENLEKFASTDAIGS